MVRRQALFVRKERNMTAQIVIIGAGPAGVTMVETLRRYDQHSRLVMISAEPYPPYSPPAMVDHFMYNSYAHLWKGEDWPEKMGVDYRSGIAVSRVDASNREVYLEDGTTLPFSYLVIASGSRLYAPVPGAEMEGVYNFKSLSMANALLERIKQGKARSAIIVGAGFIGVEIALLLRHLGVEVIQIEMLHQVMPAMLDEASARFAQQIMEEKGVDLRLGTKASHFFGNGLVKGVKLENGESLEADILIAATGVRPNIDFLQGSGIQAQWGIRVDSHLRTNYPYIYAAGDVVEAPDRITGETYVHAIFPNATAQGHLVGLNLAGFEVSYEGAERMNSLKHLGLPILAVGLKHGDELLEVKGNGYRRALYLQENRLVGYQLVGDIRIAGALRTLMLRGEKLAPIKERLLSPDFGQGSLVWNSIGL